MKTSIIKNIVFDLGGVIMNLRFEKMVEAFQALGLFVDFENDYANNHQQNFINDFETGEITPAQFRDIIRQNANADITDEQIDNALNIILSEVPPARIECLKKIKNHYRTFLFSNTNQINEDCYRATLKEQFGVDIFDELFEEAFMSHHIGMRKPAIESFQYVAQKRGLIPEETLFIDDLEANIEGAKKAGWQGFHLANGMEMNELFDFEGKLNAGLSDE